MAINNITLGEDQPLSNDLKPIKVGGEASPIEMSTSLPDGSDNGKVKVRGDLEVTGGLNFKNDVEVDLSFDDLSLSGDLDVTGNANVTGNIAPSGYIELTGIPSDPADGDKVRIGRTDAYTSEILQINSNDGYLRLGAYNASYCHFVTDRPMFYFNQDISVDTGLISSFNEDLIIRRVFNDTSYNQITLGDDSFELKLDNTARVSVDGDGNVGIGTTSPTADLHINSANSTKLYLTCSDSNPTAAAAIRFSEQEDGANNYFELDYSGSANTLAFHSNNQGNMFTLDRSNNRIFTDTAKVGIGISVPTTTLDVEGTVSYKHTAFTTAGPTDNVDVSDTTVLEVDTSSNNVTIGGFTGGVQGQILYIVKTDTANFIQLEHNEGGGSQDIFLTSGSDDRVVGYGGFTLYCNGTSWFSLSNPTGAADAG